LLAAGVCEPISEVQRAPTSSKLVALLTQRLVTQAGVPMQQLRFTGFLPHHRLLAVFR
jgi:16S rRNA C1402 (ribose-2'-O) methylase RsmI